MAQMGPFHDKKPGRVRPPGCAPQRSGVIPSRRQAAFDPSPRHKLRIPSQFQGGVEPLSIHLLQTSDPVAIPRRRQAAALQGASRIVNFFGRHQLTGMSKRFEKQWQGGQKPGE